MKKIIIGLLIVFGIPTTIAAVYRSYLKNGSELVISELSSIELYKKCMMTIATLSPSKEEDAKKVLIEMKNSSPKVKESDSKMALVNNVAGEKSGNVGAIAPQLDNCVNQLEHELNMSSK
ncbi:hypothetical protein ACVBEG_06900 [Pseudomonas sp. GG8]